MVSIGFRLNNHPFNYMRKLIKIGSQIVGILIWISNCICIYIGNFEAIFKSLSGELKGRSMTDLIEVGVIFFIIHADGYVFGRELFCFIED